MTTIGVLALQGDFLEHEDALLTLGAGTRQVRNAGDLAGICGLIIPGGESTTFSRLIHDFRLLEPLRRLIAQGVPVWGTCAGLILLARRVDSLGFPTLGALDISVRRNGYGRQADSFEAELSVEALGAEPYPGIFIRAPLIMDAGQSVQVLARVPGGNGGRGQWTAVAVRQGNCLGTSFHPELTADVRFHRYFLEIVTSAGGEFTDV